MLLLRRELEDALDLTDVDAAFNARTVIRLRGDGESRNGTEKSKRKYARKQPYFHRAKFPKANGVVDRSREHVNVKWCASKK